MCILRMHVLFTLFVFVCIEWCLIMCILRTHVLFMLFVFVCIQWCPTLFVMCFCFLCLVCPVLQVYLDCLSLVFSNVYLVHLCSLFNGQLTNSSLLWILFVLSYLTCSGFIWLFTLLVILSYLPFLVLSYLPFQVLSYIPFFGIELSPIFGIELSSILWY